MKLSADERLEKSPGFSRLKLKILQERAGRILYPRTCPVCGRIIRLNMEDWSVLVPESENFLKYDPFICKDCAARLEPCAGRARCFRCSKPLDDDREEYCRDCRTKTRYFDRGIAALIHNEASKEVMYALKYSHLKVNADFAAFELARALLQCSGGHDLLDVDVIIPVPLHSRRFRERGYNQAELIARNLELFLELAGNEPIPVDTDYLARKKRSARLKELSGQQRTEELAGVFEVTGEPGRYRRVLLIDDIFTTGATLNECAKTLRAAGVSAVFFLTATIGS